MKSNSFYENFLNFNHFSRQIFFNLVTVFAEIANLKMQTCFIFQALNSLKVSIVLRKLKESYFEKMF